MSRNIFTNERNLVAYAAGDVIMQPGDAGGAMYGIADGEVEITIDGRVVETATPGAFFGEMSLIDQEPRSAGARAKTDCRLALIDEPRFLFLVQNTPFFALEVMRTMATRLRRRD